MPLKSPDCFSCHCKECSILKNCSKQWLSLINKRKSYFQCRKGQAFIYEGLPLTEFYFIFQGKVKVVAKGLYGKQQIKRLANTGDILGFRGLGANYIFPASVFALEDTYVCSIDKELFLDLLKANPELMFETLLLVTEELRKTERRMKNLTMMNVREKIADTLLYIYEVFGNTSTKELDIILSRQEIAELAMTTKEQISKCLTEFEQEGKINIDGKKIFIANFHALKNMLEAH